jgi:hypothetical protein
LILKIAIKACLEVIFEDFVKKTNISKLSKNHLSLLSETLVNWKGLFPKFVTNETDQQNLIAVIEDLCIQFPQLADGFHLIIQYLNSDKIDALSDGVLKRWYEDEVSQYPTSEEGMKEISESAHQDFREKMKKYIDQL